MSLKDIWTVFITTEAKVSIPIFSFLCSGLFYKMGKAEGSFPSVHDTITMWQWVKEINKATGSDLRARAHIMGTAWKQAQKIYYTLKTLQLWTASSILEQGLIVSSNDAKMPKKKKTEKQLKKASKENAQLEKSQVS